MDKRETALNELKAAILWAEREARWREEVAEQRSPGLKAAVSAEAERYRIAAACMWEKLERLEAGPC